MLNKLEICVGDTLYNADEMYPGKWRIVTWHVVGKVDTIVTGDLDKDSNTEYFLSGIFDSSKTIRYYWKDNNAPPDDIRMPTWFDSYVEAEAYVDAQNKYEEEKKKPTHDVYYPLDFKEPARFCPKCGIELQNVMSYYCTNNPCAVGLGGTTC